MCQSIPLYWLCLVIAYIYCKLHTLRWSPVWRRSPTVDLPDQLSFLYKNLMFKYVLDTSKFKWHTEPSLGHTSPFQNHWKNNRIYHHTVEETRESHPSVHGLQSCCKWWTRGWGSLVPSTVCWLIIFLPRLLFLINNAILTSLWPYKAQCHGTAPYSNVMLLVTSWRHNILGAKWRCKNVVSP